MQRAVGAVGLARFPQLGRTTAHPRWAAAAVAPSDLHGLRMSLLDARVLLRRMDSGSRFWRALRLRRGRGAMDRAAARDGEIDGARVAVAVRGDGGAGEGAFHRLGVWKVRARR